MTCRVSITTFRKAKDFNDSHFLQNATAGPAQVQGFHHSKPFLLSKTPAGEPDRQKYMSFLCGGVFGKWLDTTKYDRPGWIGAVKIVDRDSAVEVPLLRLARAFTLPELEEDDTDEMMSYILIVEGANCTRHKVLVAHSRHEAAELAMFEVSNGYSIVFTAAVLQDNIADVSRLAIENPPLAKRTRFVPVHVQQAMDLDSDLVGELESLLEINTAQTTLPMQIGFIN
ncbi:MAG: hypothetical protein Q9162_004440 [Coniocarpon cinnabarinum]